MKPLEQGADGLCGAYAAVNAVRLLAPERFQEEERARGLIRTFMLGLSTRHGTKEELIDVIFGEDYGTDLVDLKAGLRHVTESLVSMPKGIDVRFSELPRLTFTLDTFWEHLLSHFRSGGSGTRVAIVGMRRPDNHWTVVQRIGPKTITFFDSSGEKWSARKDQCTLSRGGSDGWRGRSHAFRPKETVLLSRVSES